MRSLALASGLAATAALVSAGPTATEPELPRRADSLPTITPSGNGRSSRGTAYAGQLARRVVAGIGTG